MFRLFVIAGVFAGPHTEHSEAVADVDTFLRI